MNKISTIILTKNEETNIERAIKSVSFSDEILIFDDYSTDLTLRKIEKLKTYFKAKIKIDVFQNKLNNDFAGQRNLAMKKASNEWILFLDADEDISLELQNEITLQKTNDNRSAYYLKRRDFFWGKELKFGEVKKVRKNGLIRLVKKGSGKWSGTVHEEFIPNGSNMSGELSGYINHFPHQTLKEFITDINLYSDIRAIELYKCNIRSDILQILFYPFVKFIYNYFIQTGFLDGASGFSYAFLMSFHSFLVRTKLLQIQNMKDNTQ